MSRSNDERLRAMLELQRIETTVAAIRIALSSDAPPGIQDGQALIEAAGKAAMTLARLDIAARCEADEKARAAAPVVRESPEVRALDVYAFDDGRKVKP